MRFFFICSLSVSFRFAVCLSQLIFHFAICSVFYNPYYTLRSGGIIFTIFKLFVPCYSSQHLIIASIRSARIPPFTVSNVIIRLSHGTIPTVSYSLIFALYSALYDGTSIIPKCSQYMIFQSRLLKMVKSGFLRSPGIPVGQSHLYIIP